MSSAEPPVQCNFALYSGRMAEEESNRIYRIEQLIQLMNSSITSMGIAPRSCCFEPWRLARTKCLTI